MEGEMVGGWVKQSAFTIDLQHSLAPSTQFGTTLLNVQSYDCEVLHHSFTTVLCRENSLFFFFFMGRVPLGPAASIVFATNATLDTTSLLAFYRVFARVHTPYVIETHAQTHIHTRTYTNMRALCS